VLFNRFVLRNPLEPYALRQEEAVPRLTELEKWLKKETENYPSKKRKGSGNKLHIKLLVAAAAICRRWAL
jgi:hypothetical protein